ncbi:hypothetical protein FRC15_009885 [Serendipita sp. 397]|nr:hypothetical protein FRC15_009885 [Serendipita sp. 397]
MESPAQLSRQNSTVSNVSTHRARTRQDTADTTNELGQSYSSILSEDSVYAPLHTSSSRLRPAMADPAHGSQPRRATGGSGEAQPFAKGGANQPRYGTLPSHIGSNINVNTSRTRRGAPISPSSARFPRSSTMGSYQHDSYEHSPLGIRRPMSIVGLKESIREGWRNTLRRTPSTYDPPLDDGKADDIDNAAEASRVNGIRVWYSSFTSIDWLHDAIKDSRRRHRLRRRKSFRGRLKNALDRSTGWFIVTIVGLLAAIVAFSIVRTEQWLFDLKEGKCADGFFKAKRFCCPMSVDNLTAATSGSLIDGLNPLSMYRPDRARFISYSEECPAWQTWAELFDPKDWKPLSFASWMTEYIAYIIVALALALTSSALTLKLTASTSFVGRKDSSSVVSQTAPGKTSNADSTQVASPPTTRKVLYYAAGSGIPEIKTILSGFVIHGYLGGRTLFTKSVGLAMSVASGLSLGKEGPFVHIVCCIGNIVSRFFNKYETNEAKRREILSAASAAGVAVAFGAPVGGVLFSLEEVSYFFPPKVMWRSFFCAMIAAITLKVLNPFGTGKIVLFQVTYDQDWHAYELFFFLILGVFGGVYGAYFSKLNYRWSKHVRNGKWLGKHPKSEVAIITLITALLSFLNPYTRMGGTELVYNLFAECRPGHSHEGLCVNDPALVRPVANAIAVALLVKGALTIVTFGIKLPAGIFIPTLGVGACAGRILGLGIQWLSMVHPTMPVFDSCKEGTQCVVPGVYAMIGAAATLSGVTRTTVSLAVIMFELTGTLTYVVPVMLSVLVAKTVADALEPKGIYDLVIELNQLPYLDHKAEYRWGVLTVADVMDKKVDVINVDKANTVGSLQGQLSRVFGMGTLDGGFPIVTRQESGGLRGWKMIGYISHNELEHALNVVGDEPDTAVQFRPLPPPRDYEPSAVSSIHEGAAEPDPFDFTMYMDQAPLMVQAHSPLEIVQQMFVKLGARYVVVVNTNGFYEGVIDKKGWLQFLNELEEHS